MTRRTSLTGGQSTLCATFVVLAVVIAGCGGGSGASTPGARTPEARRPASDAELITRLLAARARAVKEDDGAAFAATSTGPQRARDRRTQRHRKGLPISDFGYAVAQTDIDGGRRARLEVQVNYRLRGVSGRFTVTRLMDVVKRGTRWRVSAEPGSRDRLPWEVERYRARRAGHFLILAPASLDLGLDGVLEQAYDRIRSRIRGVQLRRRYLVVVASDARQARRLTAQIRGVETLSAITDAKVQDEGPAKRVAKVISLRLLVVASALQSLDAENRLRVLSHELTHAALTEETSGRTPAWLGEGIALYVSEDRRVQEAGRLVASAASRAERRALTLTALSAPDAIARLSGPAQSASYAYASAAAFYIAARYGERRLLRLYDAFNDEELSGEAGAELTSAAVQKVLKRPLQQLERDLRAWILARSVVGGAIP